MAVAPTKSLPVWQPGEAVGRYTLLSKIATGGMAEIWLARQAGPRGFEKVVVIEKIIDTFSSNPEFVEMFLDEARIAAQLSHPNIVQIFDLGEHAGAWFIAMEYLPGENLTTIARTSLKANQPLPFAHIVKIIAEACEALGYAHAKTGVDGRPLNIVHRDVSPQNIVVTYDGQVKLVDFGIAKAANKASQTASGYIKGKFAYIAPEQAVGESIDGRADLFSLGVILYELCTGTRLFKADNELKVLGMVVAPVPVELARHRNPEIPPALGKIIDKAVCKPVDERYQDARSFQQALEDWLKEQGSLPGSSDLADLMRRLFAERIAARATVIETASRGEQTPSGARAVLQVDTQPSMPGVPGPGLKAGQVKPWTIAVAAAALIALAAGGLLLARRSAPAPAQVVEVPLTGSLSIDTEPRGAAIAIDGHPSGRSPLVVGDLALASHEVEAVLEGRQTERRSVVLANAGEQVTVMLMLAEEPPRRVVTLPENPTRPPSPNPPPQPAKAVAAKGKLTINTKPWTKVYLRGKLLGETPLVEVPMPAGHHLLRLVNEPAKVDRTIDVEIKAGQVAIEKLTL